MTGNKIESPCSQETPANAVIANDSTGALITSKLFWAAACYGLMPIVHRIPEHFTCEPALAPNGVSLAMVCKAMVIVAILWSASKLTKTSKALGCNLPARAIQILLSLGIFANLAMNFASHYQAKPQNGEGMFWCLIFAVSFFSLLRYPTEK